MNQTCSQKTDGHGSEISLYQCMKMMFGIVSAHRFCCLPACSMAEVRTFLFGHATRLKGKGRGLWGGGGGGRNRQT